MRVRTRYQEIRGDEMRENPAPEGVERQPASTLAADEGTNGRARNVPQPCRHKPLSETLEPHYAHFQCNPSLVLGDVQVCGNRLEVLHQLCFFIICES